MRDENRYLCAVCGGLHPVWFSHDEYISISREARGYEEDSEEDPIVYIDVIVDSQKRRLTIYELWREYWRLQFEHPEEETGYCWNENLSCWELYSRTYGVDYINTLHDPCFICQQEKYSRLNKK